MQGNWTDGGGGGGSDWSPESIITLVTGIGGCVASLLTFAYFKFKQQFRDQQGTNVKLSHTINKDGSTTLEINMQLLNDENYMLEHKTALKSQSRPGDLTSDDQLSLVPALKPDGASDDLRVVVSNNHKGDQIIGQTRNHIVRDALNAGLKLVQLHYQRVDESPLDLSVVHSPLPPPHSKPPHKHPVPLHNYNKMKPVPPDPIKLARSTEESKESPEHNSVAVLGANADTMGSLSMSVEPAVHDV